MNKIFNCWPVIIYTSLSVIQIIISLFTNKDKLEKQIKANKGTYIFSQLVSTFIGYCILFVLCYYNYFKMAWVILFLPIILIVVTLLISIFSKKQKEQFQSAGMTENNNDSFPPGPPSFNANLQDPNLQQKISRLLSPRNSTFKKPNQISTSRKISRARVKKK